MDSMETKFKVFRGGKLTRGSRGFTGQKKIKTQPPKRVWPWHSEKCWLVLQRKRETFSSWWLNQPIRKICSSNWIMKPQGFGVKIKNIWNHHLVFSYPRDLITERQRIMKRCTITETKRKVFRFHGSPFSVSHSAIGSLGIATNTRRFSFWNWWHTGQHTNQKFNPTGSTYGIFAYTFTPKNNYKC